MSTLLTQDYKKIGQIVLQDSAQDNILYIYGKTKEPNADKGETTTLLKVTYYRSAGKVSFYNGELKINDKTAKKYTSLKEMTAGENEIVKDYEVTIGHNEDGTSKEQSISIVWDASNGGDGSTTIEVEAIDIPLVSITDIKKDSARAYVSTFDKKGLTVTGGGWDFTEDPDINKWDYIEGDSLDKVFTNLKPETTYYLRTYVITSGGGVNSKWTSFTTKKNNVVRLRVSESWKESIPYIYAGGSWKEATPYVNVDGSYKEVN